jgi:signal transduction histidine kinase
MTPLQALASVSGQHVFRASADWLELQPLPGGNLLGHDSKVCATWLQDYVHPDDHLNTLRAIEQALRHGDRFDVEHRLWRHDGEFRLMHTRAIAARDSAGKVIEWIGTAADITDERHNAEELLRHRAQIEERVLERTAELDAANGALRDEILDKGRAQRSQHELLRQLANAQENERRRISRELHDEVGQQLAALTLGLNELAVEHHVPAESPKLRELHTIANTIARQIHDLAVELRPTSLDDLGLERALSAYVATWGERTKIKVDFHAGGFDGSRLDSTIETTVYRVVQEALQNIRRHARATAVSVILERKPHEVGVIIEDDGAGFDPLRRQKTERLGLIGMRERAGMVGGTLRVESAAGRGTTVFLRVPYDLKT